MTFKIENSGSLLIEGDIDIGSLLRVYDQFHQALKVADSDLEKTGTILLFRSTYDLCWKTLQKLLQARGLEPNTPKTVLREAALEKLIDSVEPWLEFAETIDKADGAYNPAVASEIFSDLNHFDRETDRLIKRLQTLN